MTNEREYKPSSELVREHEEDQRNNRRLAVYYQRVGQRLPHKHRVEQLRHSFNSRRLV